MSSCAATPLYECTPVARISAITGAGCVSDRVGDAGVPEEMLKPPGVHAARREGVARRVTQYVDMDREWQLSGLASPFYHAPNAHPAERLATLIEEDVVGLDGLFSVGPPKLA
jgi:hypothetical protein